MRGSRWILLVVGVVALGVLAWAWKGYRPAQAGPARPPGDRVVPVLAATVAARDMPIFKSGLGSAVAFATVTIRPQVDGRIDKLGFVEGQDVKKGDLIAQIDPRPFQIQLQLAEAALARDRTTARNDRVNLERYKALAEKGLVPGQQVDDQRATTESAESSLAADQAAIQSARLNLSFARVTSPIDGRTGIRLVDAGNLVHATDPIGIVVVTQLDPIVVLFTLPEDDLPDVAKAMAGGPLSVEAWSRDGKQLLAKGVVALVDNQINQATGTIKIKAVFANAGQALWPNQFVKARLLLTTRKGALVVPASVVQRGQQGTFAYVIDPSMHVAVRPVEIEPAEGDLAIVTRGLEAGERVVADGQYQLAPGASVSLKAPPPDRSAAPPAAGGSAPPAPSAAPARSAAPP